MALQLGDLRSALVEAGASPAPAAKAAEEVAAYEHEFTSLRGEISHLRTDMSDLRADLREDMSDLRTDLRSEMNDLRVGLRSEMGDLRTEVGGLRPEMTTKFASVDADIRVLKWGQGVTFAAVLAILLKGFLH
jgi:predicted  nucleic acid-binding Zn-ribbon protein